MVLKVAIPDGLEGNCPFARELQTLLLGDGRGYVRVLASDLDRRAMLQERLGAPLSSFGLSVEAQIDVITATVAAGWRAVPAAIDLRTGREQATFLEAFIGARSDELGQPCPAPTIELARHYARARRDAFDASTAVLIHGDAHPANILAAPSAAPSPTPQRQPKEFKLIDPDGMRSEPAHDLAIPLRDWTAELLAGDAVELGLAWCARLSERADVDARAIWEWAFVERVSTGLFMLQLGDPRGVGFLEVAARWTGAHP